MSTRDSKTVRDYEGSPAGGIPSVCGKVLWNRQVLSLGVEE